MEWRIYGHSKKLKRRSGHFSNYVNSLQIVEVVCCKMTELQTNLYRHFIRSKNVSPINQNLTADLMCLNLASGPLTYVARANENYCIGVLVCLASSRYHCFTVCDYVFLLTTF